MIVTHSNELFDMYTLNKYTVEFYKKYFLIKNSTKDISELLIYPNKPNRIIFSIRENPLIYKFKLLKYGFKEVQQEFANFHQTPPILLMPEKDFEDIDKKEQINTLNWPEQEKWKLMFMCSMFGSRAIKL